ncbi:MAG: glycosyltransferase family 4 protein [Brumimicrobium sp.]|nr:glycosyltransferase family 4 protein [Brumimicrobium sp.]
MNILIVGKQKKDKRLSVLTHRQSEALKRTSPNEISVTTYGIESNGIIGYVLALQRLRKHLSNSNFDVIHAHYSLIGALVVLAQKKERTVVSFMGSDVYLKGIIFKLARWLILKKADYIIVKSERLRNQLKTKKNLSVVPNGVNTDLFHPIDKNEAKTQLGWQSNRIHIIFPAGKNRYEKNFNLAIKAVTELGKIFPIELHLLENIDPDRVPVYLNAADIVLLTSRWEGSSNVTKEAMACNTAVVSTDVGDANELFDKSPGYYISKHSVKDVILKLKLAITFLNEKKTPEGRKRILELNLDEDTTAKKILNIYKQVHYKI